MKLPRAALAATVAALTVGLAACATASDPPPSPFSDAPGDREIRIEIQNLNFSDATVWAVVQSGRRIRLGTVRGKSDSIFTLPWEFSLPLSMDIDMLAGPRCRTEGLQVDPGDFIQLQIQPVFSETERCR